MCLGLESSGQPASNLKGLIMHDDRVLCIVSNAFQNDSTGSDDFGWSVAWIDLDDFMEPDGLDNYELYPYSDDVSAYVKTLPEIDGARFALAYWDADGSRSVVAYDTRAQMFHAYRALEADFFAFESA